MDKTAIFLLILGFILLLVSGKYLVESSVTLARHFRIPTSIIGLTIVAFGTSAPELLVSIQAALQGHPDMAVGNVIGSNISNVLLVLGLTTIVFPILVQRGSIVRDWPMMMGVSLVLLLFLLDNEITRLEGVLLAILMGVYILISIRQARLPQYVKPEDITVMYKTKWWVAGIVFLVACAGLAIGAALLVDNAAAMAQHFGISERVISITMVAVGTSLPELSTSLIAAFKKETDISIGNILGSNIINILSVLGVTALIKPITTVPEVLRIDIPWMLGAAVLLFLFMIPARNGRINRIEGSVMVLGYATYIYFIFIS